MAKPSTGQQLRAVGDRPCGDGRGDRVLAGVLERAGEPEQLAPAVGAGADRVDQLHAPGGDGAGLVEDDRVDRTGGLEDLRALDQDAHLGASTGARPGARSGVARPRAQGQAMISTATAAVNASVAAAPGAEPEPEGGRGDHDDGRDEHGRHAVGQALDLGLAGLGVGHQLGDVRQRRVGADPGGLHDQAARRC